MDLFPRLGAHQIDRGATFGIEEGEIMKKPTILAALTSLVILAGMLVSGQVAQARDCQKSRFGNTYYCGNSPYSFERGPTGDRLKDRWGKSYNCRENFFTGKIVCR